MDLLFKVCHAGHEVAATVARPLTTRFSVAVDGVLVAESSRPASTDVLCGIETWFGMRPVWEISGTVQIDARERRVTAKHFTTFTRQYVELFVDGEMIGPESKGADLRS